jgi:hypothetical protein
MPDAVITIQLNSLQFESDHGLLKDCGLRAGWRKSKEPCAKPEWTPSGKLPVSHSMGEKVRLSLVVRGANEGVAPMAGTLRGVGPAGMIFERQNIPIRPEPVSIGFVSNQAIERKIYKLEFTTQWSTPGMNATLAPPQTTTTMYVTMGRPVVGARSSYGEEGVTLRRMDRAVEWVAPLNTLDPHEIAAGLMKKFPGYELLPSPKVPKQYKHPTYFNREGGAWAMSEYAEEGGECQAIVRLMRAIFWQLGIPGETESIAVWADPNVEGGERAISANWEANHAAGLNTAQIVNGQRWVASLVDGPVEEGKSYPASHTRLPGDAISPGLNRYEACMKFTHAGVTRYYCGGAGILETVEQILHVFWGLIWVSRSPGGGFRVERIVKRYQA